MTPRREDGFTLVELVVTVTMVGVVAAALAGVVMTSLRTSVDARARMGESHDVQLVAAYWQRDVASLGVRSVDYDRSTHTYPLQESVGLAACALPAGAVQVVTLAWSEYGSLSAPLPVLVKVTYAARAQGGAYELLRVRCGTRASTTRFAATLVRPPELVCVQPGGGASCSGTPSVLRLHLDVHDTTGRATGTYQATLSGERRQS